MQSTTTTRALSNFGRGLLGVIVASLLCSGAGAEPPQAANFDGCGVLVQSGLCVLFQADNGNTYLLENGNGSFGVGDYIHVTGDEHPCLSSCFASACITTTAPLSLCISDPSTAFCFGDGNGGPCPCGNNGSTGQGCANSSGVGGSMTAFGTDSVSSDDLTFQAAGLLGGQPALLFSADNAVNGGNGTIFGDGLRCAGGNVVRLGVQIPSALGEANWGPGLGASGGWSGGQTKRFQTWYRDPSGSPCGSSFNLTSGLEVSFTP